MSVPMPTPSTIAWWRNHHEMCKDRALNRGVLLTPFHMMALMSPATSAEDVDRHSAIFREAVAELFP